MGAEQAAKSKQQVAGVDGGGGADEAQAMHESQVLGKKGGGGRGEGGERSERELHRR